MNRSYNDSLTLVGTIFKTVGNRSVPYEGYFASSWEHMTNSYSRFTIAAIFTVLIHEVAFFVLCLPGFVAQFLPFMRRFKIQQEKPESFENQWKCLKLLLFNHFCIQMPFLSSTFIYIHIMDVPHEYQFISKWYVVIPNLFGWLVLDDTFHYFMHRLLHHNLIYKYVHKVHHQFQAPFGIAAQYIHWMEIPLFSVGYLLGLLIFCDHLVMIWFLILLRLVESVDVHSGYYFPYLNPLHLIPGYVGARFHDFHHSNFNGNYASTFLWWDWLFGTDKQWREFCANKAIKKE